MRFPYNRKPSPFHNLWTLVLVLLVFVLLASVVTCTDGNDEFKCSLPDVTSIDTELDLTRFRADFSKISEVKFPSLIGPLNEKLICKIKCIDGNWVGPLCSNTADGRFQPVLRECAYRMEQPLLSVTFKNSSITEPTVFPHGSVISARCRLFGLYKIKGEGTLRCENGEWTPKFPECVPTTLITNFTGDAPPTILYTLVSGSASVEPTGELFVYPDSVLRLDCITMRALGDPDWSWTQALGQHSAAWSSDDAEKETHYRLTLSKMSARHSDQYTCTSPGQHTNTITVKVVNAICPPLNVSAAHLIAFSEGTRLGHSVHYSCEPGYHLAGAAVVICMGEGRWSDSAPTCVETSCPVLRSLGPHLSVVEYNSSYGGRAVFQCAWGYRLVGPPGVECEQDGRWSGATPLCIPIYCPKPLVPEHGRVLSDATKQDEQYEEKYPVGDLVVYACDEGFQVVGESSIVCTENGFWSHPPPFCVVPSDIVKSDTIYLENTTLVHVDE